jgi:5'-phosphate synthase pdxT subunit
MIGILDLQGDVVEHTNILKKLNIKPIKVKTLDDLKKVKGLILPGGESTTMMKLLNRNNLTTEIKKRTKLKSSNKKHLLIYGTCAGAILLAKKITNFENQETLNLMDIEIQRNGYGRQLDSFEKTTKVFNKKINCIFIRAPVIKRIQNKNIIIHASLNKSPILIQQDNILISTFHPELTNNTLIHKYFVDMVNNPKNYKLLNTK